MPDSLQSTSNHPDRSPGAALLSTAAAVVPPAFAGTALGWLLVYLNPNSASFFDGWLIAGLYALLGLSASVVLVLPFVWCNLRRAAAWFPWAVSAFLLTAAVYFGVQASRWSFYLSPQVNRRLVIAALVLFGLGLIGFYTALLHSLHRRSYSHRSLGLVTACGLVAIGALAILRPDPSPARRPTVTISVPVPAVEDAEMLVVIGLDGATLEALLPLAEEGNLPLLSRWMREGVLAPVTTLRPPRPSAMWSSVATGTWPFRHRLRGPRLYSLPVNLNAELSLLPDAISFARWGLLGAPSRPASANDLARQPLWRVLSQVGRDVEVYGWTASSDPRPRRASELARIAPSADVVFILLEDLALASQRAFGAWVATQRGSRRTGLEARAEELEAAYVEVDRALAAWEATLPEQRTVVVISSHGFAPQARWRELLARFTGQPAGRGTARGGQDGIIILHGPEIRRGERLPALRLVDVMPTLAYAAGLPVAADLDGEVATRAFAPVGLARRPLTFVPSYESWGSIGAAPRTGG